MNGWDDKERRPYLAYTNDGLMELILGAALMLAALMLETDFMYLAGVWIVLLIPIMWSLKRWITVPRLSEEDLAQVNMVKANKMRIFLMIALGLLFLGGALVFVTFFSESLFAEYARIFWMLASFGVVLALIVLMGYQYDQKRWYGYALWTLVVVAGVFWLGATLMQAFLAIGGVIFVVGLYSLVRFLRTHPKLPETSRPAM